MSADDNARSDQRLIKELAGQFRKLGMEAEPARELAREEVLRGRKHGGMPPYLVIPHAKGWNVTRAYATTDAEVFARREEAEERARELAAGEGSEVIVCDASGRALTRTRPKT